MTGFIFGRNQRFRILSFFLCACDKLSSGGDRRGAAARKSAAKGSFLGFGGVPAALFAVFPPEAEIRRSPPEPASLLQIHIEINAKAHLNRIACPDRCTSAGAVRYTDTRKPPYFLGIGAEKRLYLFNAKKFALRPRVNQILQD